jgi:hypothetical protein
MRRRRIASPRGTDEARIAAFLDRRLCKQADEMSTSTTTTTGGYLVVVIYAENSGDQREDCIDKDGTP